MKLQIVFEGYRARLKNIVSKHDFCFFSLLFLGYVVQGSNAEWCFQSWEERVQVVRETAKLAAPGKLIMAGSGCECKIMKGYVLYFKKLFFF